MNCPEPFGLARETARAALADAGIGAAEVSLVLSDDGDDTAAEPALARQGRADQCSIVSRPEKARMLGDVVSGIRDRGRGRPRKRNKPLAHHFRHLIVHGVLHLLGHDHEAESDAVRMENRERRILREFGVPDPYRIANGCDHG